MRAVIGVVVAGLLAWACGAPRTGGVTFEGQTLCVPEAKTVDLGAGQARAGDAIGACKTWPAKDVIADEVRRTCGPCGFVFDAAATRTARGGGRGDACCYTVSSPPPPPR